MHVGRDEEHWACERAASASADARARARAKLEKSAGSTFVKRLYDRGSHSNPASAKLGTKGRRRCTRKAERRPPKIRSHRALASMRRSADARGD
eukprot:6183668-Pleurochrysis_carterae.AAC.2